MADAVATQTILDGPKNVVMKFTNVSDATGESAVTKVNPATVSPTCTRFRIDRIDWACAGMGVDVLWDATTDVLAYHLPQGTSDSHDFLKRIGGLSDPKASGYTGIIKFTTLGAEAGDRYAITLYLSKKFD